MDKLLAQLGLLRYAPTARSHEPLIAEMLISTRARRLQRSAELRAEKCRVTWDSERGAISSAIVEEVRGDLADPLNTTGDKRREGRILRAVEEHRETFEQTASRCADWYQRFGVSQNHVPYLGDREKFPLHASGILVLDYPKTFPTVGLGQSGLAVLIDYVYIDKKPGSRPRLCSHYCGYEPTYRRAIELGRAVWLRHTMPYADYLKTDHWKTVREEAIRNAAGRCEGCASTERLEVHHRTYARRGFENIKLDLRAFCARCHGNIHEKF